LRDYFEAKLTAMDNAIGLARTNMERRLDGMNEFRDTLRDQASTFVGRRELSTVIERLDADIRSLRESRAELGGKASMSAVYLGYALALLAIAVSVFSIVYK